MPARTLPSKFLLDALLLFEPQDGSLVWLERPVSMFTNSAHSAQHQCDKWNAANADKTAISYFANGYGYTLVDGKRFLSHRLIWKMVFNTEPIFIDHINGVRSDNRLSNLRSVDRATNARNMKRSVANTSGTTGVSWRKDKGKWRAYIAVDGKHLSLGVFSDLQDAISARKAAEIRYDYHSNHGR